MGLPALHDVQAFGSQLHHSNDSDRLRAAALSGMRNSDWQIESPAERLTGRLVVRMLDLQPLQWSCNGPLSPVSFEWMVVDPMQEVWTDHDYQ